MSKVFFGAQNNIYEHSLYYNYVYSIVVAENEIILLILIVHSVSSHSAPCIDSEPRMWHADCRMDLNNNFASVLNHSTVDLQDFSKRPPDS